MRQDDPAGRRADEGADHRRHHGERKQEIGVAQDLAALLGGDNIRACFVREVAPYRLAIRAYGFEFHRSSLVCT